MGSEIIVGRVEGWIGGGKNEFWIVVVEKGKS